MHTDRARDPVYTEGAYGLVPVS